MPYWTLRVFVTPTREWEWPRTCQGCGLHSLGVVQASSVMSQRGWRGKQYREREREMLIIAGKPGQQKWILQRETFGEQTVVLLPNSVWTYYEYVWKEKKSRRRWLPIVSLNYSNIWRRLSPLLPRPRSSPSAATRPRRRWTRCRR